MLQAGGTAELPKSFIPIKILRLPTDPFFDEGNWACAHGKQTVIALDEEDLLHKSHKAFECQIAGCNQVFTTLHMFEEHYGSNHCFVCVQCRRNFPSNHLLELHVLERHDSLFQLMATKKDMYNCLVQTCSQEFASPTARKDHVIKFHKFPANFRFGDLLCAPVTNTAHRVRSNVMIKVNRDTAREELNRSCSMEITVDGPDVPALLTTDQLSTRKINYVCRVPGNICFGQGAPRGFQRSKKKNKKKQANIDMSTLSNALLETVDDPS